LLIYLFKTSYWGDHTYTFGGKKFSQTEFVPDTGSGPKFSMFGDSHDPILVEQGMLFQNEQYLVQNESFTYTGSEFSIEFWIYQFEEGARRIYGGKVQGPTDRTIYITIFNFSGEYSFRCYIDTSPQINQMISKLGWNIVGCKSLNGSPAGYSSNKLATTDGIIGNNWHVTNHLKLGWFWTWVNDYIIYSMKFKDAPDLGNSVNSFSVINPYYTCGDNNIQTISIEQWDDGNYVNGDGWNEGWLSESGPCISNPLSCLTELLPEEIWGDSKKTTSEEWDDGNIIGGDGWDSNCQIEHNWVWSGGSDTTTSNWNICVLKNWFKWQTTTHLKCSEWNAEYKLDENNIWVHNSVILMSASAQQLASGISAVTAFGASASIIVAILNVAFPAALWSMINQMQLLQLLILIGWFIPDDAKGMLTGNIQISFGLIFTPLEQIPYIVELLDIITFEQTNPNLRTIGIMSGSSLRNWIKFIFIICLILLAHSITWWLPKFKLDEDSTKCRKNLNRGVKRITRMFTFTLYIRVILESYQLLLLANISNVNEFDTSSTLKIITLIFSLFILVCLTIFILLSFYTYCVSRGRQSNEPRLKCEEFLGGIKYLNKPRLYSFISLSRRLEMILLLIWGETLGPQIVAIVLILILIVYLFYIIPVKPFKEVSNNIIEIINELFLVTITAWLCYFNTEDDWNDSVTKTYMFIITGNTLVVTAIILLSFIIKLAKYCVNCCWRKKKRVMTKPIVIKVENSRSVSGVSPNISFVQSTSKINSESMNANKELVKT